MHALSETELSLRILTFLPIVACSTIGFGLALAKWAQLRRARSGERLIRQVRGIIGAREYARALAVARADRSPAARLIERSLAAAERGNGHLTEQIEQMGRDLARELDFGLGGLALIATLGPLLGLFGTVVGIVVVFERLAATDGVLSASQLAGGIGTALYTTIAGLLVGMLALVTQRLLAALVDRTVAQLEAVGLELAQLLSEGVS